MTPSPSSYSYSGTATRTRVKWDNIAIVLMGAVVATFAVVAILATSDKAPAQKPVAKPAPVQDTEQTDATATDDGELSLEDAQSLAEEARQFIAQARWDEAADRLATIPEEYRTTVDADAIEAELTKLRGEYDQLRSELTAAVEAHQWAEAKTLLAKLAKIAPLDADLLATQAQVTTALGGGTASTDKPATDKPASTTGKPKPSGTNTTNSTSTSGGGGTSTTHHHSTTHTSGGATTTRPGGGTTTRPSGGTSTANNTSGSPTVNIGGQEIDINKLGSMNLSDEELEAALAQLGVSDLSELGLS
jgi:hypothetical protein